jgi:hypothetical protein
LPLWQVFVAEPTRDDDEIAGAIFMLYRSRPLEASNKQFSRAVETQSYVLLGASTIQPITRGAPA